jgi:hypothetical protein
MWRIDLRPEQRCVAVHAGVWLVRPVRRGGSGIRRSSRGWCVAVESRGPAGVRAEESRGLAYTAQPVRRDFLGPWRRSGAAARLLQAAGGGACERVRRAGACSCGRVEAEEFGVVTCCCYAKREKQIESCSLATIAIEGGYCCAL